MRLDLPPDWKFQLQDEWNKPIFRKLEAFVDIERARGIVYPPDTDVFSAFHHTPWDKTRIVLIGQDPYHDEGQAHGLCFSVRTGVTPPPSLRNILHELSDDMGFPIPDNGCLIPWAEQGVLLLNTVLTVRAHRPNSHRGQGWELFTDTVIRKLSEKDQPVIFVLWGAWAQTKAALIDTVRHPIIASVHPSPFSARRGFFGSRPFSRINQILETLGQPPVNWQIPNVGK